MNKIEFGDCRETMRKWKEQGIKAQTCVTSPPYYGLRDYGTATWEGGDASCKHSISMPTKWNDPKRGENVLRPEVGHRGGSSKHCHLCGALRVDNQIGLEETPEDYIANMVEVFRCVWDVLEDDGTLWINIGDSYNGSGGQGTKPNIMSKEAAEGRGGKAIKVDGIKPKDIIGIPWMLAFALRADGWYLRQDIIWHKPNPMPESVQDRCTKAHEYIFLLSKSQKYYYDIEAIKEPALDVSMARMQRGVSDTHKNVNGAPGQTPHSMNQPRQNMKNMQADGQSPNSFHKSRQNGEPDEVYENRNKRSVWTVTTKPYAGAHFAVFPSDLIEPCILAGAPVNGIVLDPFMGSGTTAQVAQHLGRQYIGCELNESYKPLQNKRLAQQSLIFED
jgi:DNA modification methylase